MARYNRRPSIARRNATRRRRTPTPVRFNPAQAADAMYTSFTGLQPESTLDVRESIHVHTHLAAIAELHAFKLKGVRTRLMFGKGTYLGVNETGTQLFIRGGDQAVNLSDFNAVAKVPVDPTKEHVILGQIDKIWYYAAKPFLGRQHSKTGLFVHDFGKSRTGRGGHSGSLPYLVYDTRSKLLSIAGGVYYIKPDDYDGKHSRGIVN